MLGLMHVHMMITHHERSAWGRPLQRAGAACMSRVRSLVGFGDKDFKEVLSRSIEVEGGRMGVGPKFLVIDPKYF